MPEPTLLIVDDEDGQRTVLASYLRKKGFDVLAAASVAEATAALDTHIVDLVLTDLRMPDGSGLSVLDAAHGRNPELPVVVITAFGTVANAVEAMKRGAADYLTKPIDLDELEVLIARSLAHRALVSENRQLREQLESRHGLAGLQTQNARMQEAINVAARAARAKVSVLIRGESGTGKEVLARAIHLASARARRPFVAVNIAALPDTLLESELFGHERGAFTGADRERRGRFELADGGTLFLDEIGDLPPAAQVKLLRVLQEHAFERVGGSRTIAVDVRVLAATHRNLEALASDGRFREDLLYRLNVVTIELPPLRERREDIPSLVDHFLRQAREASDTGADAVSREAMDALMRYRYPGNIRELENIVTRALVLARGPRITTEDLPAHVLGLGHEADAPTATFLERVGRFERGLILDALGRSHGVQTRAARELGMSERHLRYKLKKYGLHQPDAEEAESSWLQSSESSD